MDWVRIEIKMQNGGVECAGATRIRGLFLLDLYTYDDFDFDLDEGETSVSANENNFMSANVNICF